MKQPDPKKHQYISFAKSSLRIAAAGYLSFGALLSAGLLFGLAEVLGIIEELV